MPFTLRHSASSLVFAVCLGLGTYVSAQPVSAIAEPVRQEAVDKATALVGQMTLDEKVDQLLNVAPAIPRLKIPAYNWWTESLHGAIGAVPTTNFPEPVGLAATFDAPLIKDVASVISVEVQG